MKNQVFRYLTLFLAFHILNFSLDTPSYLSPSSYERSGATYTIDDEIESVLELFIETAIDNDDFFPDSDEDDTHTDTFLKKVDWIVQRLWQPFDFTEGEYALSFISFYTHHVSFFVKDIVPPPPNS